MLSFATSVEWCSVLPLLRRSCYGEVKRSGLARFRPATLVVGWVRILQAGSCNFAKSDRARLPPPASATTCAAAVVPRGHLLHRPLLWSHLLRCHLLCRHLLCRHLLCRHRLAPPPAGHSFRQCAYHLLDEMASGSDDLGEAGVGPETLRSTTGFLMGKCCYPWALLCIAFWLILRFHLRLILVC
jgi:hypothetical protein